MLRFPYLDEPLTGPAPPSLPPGSLKRWRPLVPVRIIGPTGNSRQFLRALVGPGSDDTVFPLEAATLLGVILRPDTVHRIRWRGQLHALRFGDVELELTDNATTLRWSSVVAFTAANIRYPLLGNAGCLQFLNVTFLGEQQIVEIDTNATYLGATS